MRGVAIVLSVACACGRAEPRRWIDPAPLARASAQAAFLLGNRYRAGAGVPQSDARALALYREAAGAGLPVALETLALAYAHGELGLAPDDDEARRYQMEAEHALDR
jgi:TPR repeat protein